MENEDSFSIFSLKFSGAQGETRTRTDYSTRPSNVRGYQLRHLSNKKSYRLAGGSGFGASGFESPGGPGFVSAGGAEGTSTG